MNMRLLCATILFASPVASPSVHAQDRAVVPAPRVLVVPQAHAESVASLSALSRFFNVDASEDSLRPLWLAQSQGDDWSKMVATSRAARLPFHLHRLKTRDLDKFGPLLARLSGPSQFVLVEAVSRANLLLFVNGNDVLMSRAEFERHFRGEVLSLASASPLHIEESVREIKIRSFARDGEIMQSIRLLNASARPLPVKVASISCGCTGATVSPAILPPGGSGVLTAKMHATDSRLVTVNLQIGDARSPSSAPWAVVALQTRAPQVELPPTVMLSAAKGEAASASTMVRLPPGTRLMQLQVSEPWLSASVRPALPSDAKQAPSLNMEVKLSDKAPVGRFESAVRLKLAGAEVDELIVPISGMVSDDVLAEPSALVLGAHPAGSSVRKTIIVRGPRPFSITSASGSEGVKVQADPQVLASRHAVEITTRIEGADGAAVAKRATLSLSDGRTLDIDIFASVGAAPAPELKTLELKVGDAAPDFALVDAQGVLRKLSDLKGKRALLLTFFPRCFSGGCVGQLASLQRELPSFKRRNIEVWAISTDAIEGSNGLKAFSKSLGLSFPLLSDESRRVCELFGAAASPEDLARRQSVFIDRSGTVRLLDREVHVESHGRDVLARLQEQKLLP